MSTNLSGNILTLNSTSLNEETLKAIRSYYYVPDNCTAGTTVILDGIECLCVATGVTIQDSNLTRIAVDKHHDLGYYQKYVGTVHAASTITNIRYWRWGGHGTTLGNTSREVGYGLQNTIRCLSNIVNYNKGTYDGSSGAGYPFLWRGVNDFRSSHSDKWFVPSRDELKNYVYPYKSSLTFDTTTGGSTTDFYMSSSEKSDTLADCVYFQNGNYSSSNKGGIDSVRLCRAF